MFNIENQGVNTFLTYLIKPDDIIDDLSLGMLTNNKIKGVSPILYTQLNEDRFLKYNISSKAPASKMFSSIITRNRLLSVVSGILNAIMAAEEYMVDSSLLMLDLNYIYIDVSTYEVMLICLPVTNKANNTDLCQFFKNIIFGGQYDQTENCDYVPVIINYLNSTSVFSPLDFKHLVDSLKQKSKPMSTPVYNHSAPAEITPPKATITPVEKKPEYKPEKASTPSAAAENKLHPKSDDIIERPVLPVAHAQKTANKTAFEEKKMSLLYLVRHYSKENLEIYKSQKITTQQEAQSTIVDKPTKKIKDKKTTASKAKKPAGFMIPGQKPDLMGTENKVSNEQPTVTARNYPSESSVKQGLGSYVNDVSTQSADFGDTTVLVAPGVAGETALLTANVTTVVKPRPYLVRLKNGEKVLIDKPRFRIGKEKSYVDYFIGDNTAISRSHADIIVKGDSYFLVDLNSTNRTFVNGAALQGNSEIQIKNGNRIRFANEEFDFIEEI